ncbi:MAG: putative 2OG-Fe(II) oxygenase [Alphaproteobacteria bacterium]|nr:putative 2OG-Fe(II) oxygenase [Alphaproteobacteria bacterium]MCZ6844849.1 putative 2OG-Fe(II) oxygenase [Alphaproteobacteria bacterium]
MIKTHGIRVIELIFPAWLKHYVNPYHGDGERISIAFNIVVLDLPIASTRPA